MSEQREKNPDELGALWLRRGRKGEFLSGQIDGVGDVICFPVDSDNPKAPAWRVLKSKPRDDRDEAPRQSRSNNGRDDDRRDDRRQSRDRDDDRRYDDDPPPPQRRRESRW